jgi:fumarate reductase flavoprotein subunit
VICWTGAGLRIDRDARVLDAADRPIPGLFGAGEATGGMFGECYAGGGASVANAIIFGRVAGAHAAKEAVA